MDTNQKPNEEVKPETKVTPVIIISLTEGGKIVVQGPIGNKKMAINLMADALKIIANHETAQSPIIQAEKILPH